MAGVRYVGAGVLASAVGMDKHYMKVVLASHGLPLAPYAVLSAKESHDRLCGAERVPRLGYPVFVKPARGGSSLGISRVERPEQLGDAVDEARRYDPKVIVEAAVEGARELECGVLDGLDGQPPQASVVAEVKVDETYAFYDFEAKYLGEEHVRLDVPADLPDATAEEVRRLAVQAFEAIGCEGLARVDFFWTAAGIVVNEINTMPGFTTRSMFPRVWAASGLDYPALVDRLLQLALRRGTGLR
jgi:D-alanine-D-alanine ligase